MALERNCPIYSWVGLAVQTANVSLGIKIYDGTEGYLKAHFILLTYKYLSSNYYVSELFSVLFILWLEKNKKQKWKQKKPLPSERFLVKSSGKERR